MISKIINRFKYFSRFELLLWISSLLVIAISFLFSEKYNWLVLIASLVGATELIFVSKGDVVGQVLTVIFGSLYAIISFRFRYYGEMITYLGMAIPIAILSVISWLKNPYKKHEPEVKVNSLSFFQIIIMIISTIIVTAIFYFILKIFNNPNLIISTLSVTASYLAAYLMLLRSPSYAIAYCLNDIILIILWILATIKDKSYLPMIICFIVFLVNDIYGYFNWKRIKKRQLNNIN
ncbi:MAG: nicotinamide mononucleotide transporter [Oscillospiraceae bacterium]|nr:nicotinamide mononucleotide transporter [Oscillospiraceae bacterium]